MNKEAKMTKETPAQRRRRERVELLMQMVVDLHIKLQNLKDEMSDFRTQP
jgi:hypothetical protein